MTAGFRAEGQLGFPSNFHMKPCLRRVAKYKGRKDWFKDFLAEIMGQGWGGVGAQVLRAEGDSTGKWGPQENGNQKSNDPSVYWWMNR